MIKSVTIHCDMMHCNAYIFLNLEKPSNCIVGKVQLNRILQITGEITMYIKEISILLMIFLMQSTCLNTSLTLYNSLS